MIRQFFPYQNFPMYGNIELNNTPYAIQQRNKKKLLRINFYQILHYLKLSSVAWLCAIYPWSEEL